MTRTAVPMKTSVTASSEARTEHSRGNHNPKLGETIDKARPHASWQRFAEETAIGIHASTIVENERVLERNDVAFHTLDLGDMCDASSAVPEPGDMNDEVDSGADLLSDGP